VCVCVCGWVDFPAVILFYFSLPKMVNKVEYIIIIATITSGQRISTKGRMQRRIFHERQCSVTPASRELCSRLPQSRFHAVIED